MPGLQAIRSLFEHAVTSGYRSTALYPLGWIIALFLSSTLLSFYLGAPSWVGITFGSLGVVSSLMYLAAYLYFMFKDRDALRSEKYSIQRLAIEKGLVGDSLYGFFDPRNMPNPNLLSQHLAEKKEASNE